MIIIKIGGSVITDKSSYRKFKPDVMKGISDVLKRLNDRLIIIHGAGSFGHLQAKEFGLPSWISERAIRGYSIVHRDVLDLNLRVIDFLISSGLNPITVSPSDTIGERMSTSTILHFTEAGFTPVTHGDVFMKGDRLEIISGDTLAMILARKLKPKAVIFLSDVDGVFSADPKISDESRILRDLSGDMEFSSPVGDVTGGMELKVQMMRIIFKYASSVYLLNGNFPERMLHLEDPLLVGTRMIRN